MLRLRPLSRALAAALLLSSPARAEYYFLEPLSGSSLSGYVTDLSFDGSVASMNLYGPGVPSMAYRWSAAALEPLGTLGGAYSYSNGISSDGSVVAGYSALPSGSARAFRWEASSGMSDLGTLGGNASYGHGVSGDGSVVVGYSSTLSGLSRAFRWDALSGMSDLGTLGGSHSQAVAASFDGSFIAGSSDDAAGSSFAFRWSAADGMQSLGDLGGGGSYAFAISADGSAVAGSAATLPDGSLAPFRWDASSGMTRIGLGGVFGAARGLSDDGSVAVGYDLIQLPGGSYAFRSFRWDAASGSVPLSQWLSEANVPYPADLVGILAFSVSGDGTAIGGYAYRDGQPAQPFIARVSPIGSGLISDIPAFSSSLAEAGSSARESAALLPYLALFGAHHRTLLDQGFSRAGSSCAWITADRASHRSSDLEYSVGEMGFCRFFGDAVAGFALGTHSQRQDLPLGGLSEASGEYLYAELSAPAGSSGLELSASAFLSRGEADIRRAYLNGASSDSSFGSADVFSRALRLRADWRDALSAGPASLSPYASVAWLRSGSDPYSESGGGFPASFSGSDWRETDYRVGLAARIPLPQRAALRLDLSRAWRDGDSSSVSGSAVGLPVLGFSLPSSSFGSQWTRASADLDLPAGDGSLLSLGANAASDGSDPSWRLSF